MTLNTTLDNAIKESESSIKYEKQTKAYIKHNDIQYIRDLLEIDYMLRLKKIQNRYRS